MDDSYIHQYIIPFDVTENFISHSKIVYEEAIIRENQNICNNGGRILDNIAHTA